MIGVLFSSPSWTGPWLRGAERVNRWESSIRHRQTGSGTDSSSKSCIKYSVSLSENDPFVMMLIADMSCKRSISSSTMQRQEKTPLMLTSIAQNLVKGEDAVFIFIQLFEELSARVTPK